MKAPTEEQCQRDTLCRACPLRGQCRIAEQTHLAVAACPHGVWFPTVNPAIPGEIDVRHLVMFLLPVAGNGLWQENASQLGRRRELFTGRKVLTIATIDPSAPTKSRRTNKQMQTDSPDAVLEEFRRQGIEWDDVLVVQNNPAKREGATFLDMLDRVASTSLREAVFCCHGKGTTHHAESICAEWMRVMYETCLDDWPAVERALERHAVAGPFRRFGEFRTPGNHRWHYSGTFYWIRSAAMFARRWRRLDSTWFATESWPGLILPAADGACLFADDAPDLYQSHHWRDRIRLALALWRTAHGAAAD